MIDEMLSARLLSEAAALEARGLTKRERLLASPQGARVRLEDGREVLNLCANNYLGLANEPVLEAAAAEALGRYGYGVASVRFICGTQTVHRALEQRLARFLGLEDAMLFASCFDANGGLFEPFLDEKDVVFSDTLNHASIIDGLRLCRARRERYGHRDVGALEAQLAGAQDARTRVIVTDGVFSMDGTYAPLPELCALAERYRALLVVDDSHAVGLMGAQGRGTAEHLSVAGRVDVVTGTFGKALGGAAGGYVAGPRRLTALLRQRSRPYLFSNSLPPLIAATTLRALDLVESPEGALLRGRLAAHAAHFRGALETAGFRLRPGSHPIIPVMIGDAAAAGQFADALLAAGVYVVAFSHPVVPLGEARIRVQMNAALTEADLEEAVGAFVRVGRSLGLLGLAG